MHLGIVGHAQDKFTALTEAHARAAIRGLIAVYKPTLIVSGRSPLGGVDWYAEEIAGALRIPTRIFPPTTSQWDGLGGFKERNLRIAAASDLVACVVVKELPPTYHGRVFRTCYHCRGRNPVHVKSGGCWTALQCARRQWVIIE